MSDGPAKRREHSTDESLPPDGTRTVRICQRVQAPRSVIWNACARPEGIARWQADVVEGDPEAGGRLTLSWPELGAQVLLDVSRVEPERRIELANGSSRVLLEIDDAGVALEHSGLAASDDADGIRASWQVALALLAHACERHPDRARTVHWFVGRTHTSAAAAHAFFTDAAALATWLTRRGEVGAQGTRCDLELASGMPFTGRVLANTSGRDVALSWEEDAASVLCLRTLPAAEGERVVAIAWSRWSEEAPPANVRAELATAHARLLEVLDQRLWA